MTTLAHMNDRCLQNTASKKAEYLQYLPGLDSIELKYSTLIDLVQMPKDADKYPHLLFQMTA